MQIKDFAIAREITFPSGIILNVCQGDITLVRCDAIVSAANEHLMHGGGVAATIVRGGGPTIQQESHDWVAAHGPISHECPAFTTGGQLPCKFIIHAVGPRWGEGNEDHKLATTISSSLHLAQKLSLSSICFPAISTGIFGFPVERAARIILSVISTSCTQNPKISLEIITLILFDAGTLDLFTKVFDRKFKSSKQL
jgi:O-acetyl-ADP-ribose deacetylase